MVGAQRDVAWTALQWPSLEHVHVTFADCDRAMRAYGVAVAVLDGSPAHLNYKMVADAAGAVRSLELSAPGRGCTLLSDGRGHWDGRPDLDGCVDVDIEITPLTNTLPIRRLGLHPGESAEIEVAYVSVPGLEVRRATQHYTRTERGYHYASGTFAADLEVDDDGLVVTYSDLWRRA